MDIQALLWLLYTATLQVIDGVSHFRAFCDFCVTYSCRCALFLEVDHKAT